MNYEDIRYAAPLEVAKLLDELDPVIITDSDLQAVATNILEALATLQHAVHQHGRQLVILQQHLERSRDDRRRLESMIRKLNSPLLA